MANRIKALRESLGEKQIDLAQFLSVSQGTLSNWERGVHDPDNEILLRLADHFGVSTDYILGRSDIPTPPSAKKEGPPTHEEMRQAYLQFLADERGVPLEQLNLDDITPDEWADLEKSILAMIRGYKK